MIRTSVGPKWIIGDLFLFLFNTLEPIAGSLLGTVDDQMLPSRLLELRPIIDQIRQADGDIPSQLRSELAYDIDEERALDLLLAIDEAFETFSRGTSKWEKTRRSLAYPARGRSSSLAADLDGAVVLPRWMPWGERPDPNPKAGRAELRRWITWLQVSNPTCRIRWRELSPGEDLFAADQIRVGIVPLADQQDVAFKRLDVAGRPHFQVEHLAEDRVFTRLRDALVHCQTDRVDVLFAPELTLTKKLWDLVDDLLASIPIRVNAGFAPKPRWLILGTAMVEVGPDGRGFNRSRVVTFASRGRYLWEQDKINPYAISHTERKRYGLLGAIGSDEEPIPEGARPGVGGLWLLDSRILGRIAIAICEDLSRGPAKAAVELGTSTLFAPVMDGPLRSDRWAGRQASDFHHWGCRVVVANSLALPQLAGAADPDRFPPPYAFALCGDFVVFPEPDVFALAADNAANIWKDWVFDLPCRT